MRAGCAGSALLLVFGLTLCFASPASAQQPAAPVEILIQVKVERGPDSLFIALMRPDSVVLVPLRELFDLIEVRISDVVPGRRLGGRLGETEQTYGFDTEALRAWRGDVIIPLDSGDAVWRGADLYVASFPLARVLDIQIGMEWPDLLLMLSAAERLPVVRRLARERRRSVLLRDRELREPAQDVFGRPALLDGLAIDWAINSATRAPLENSGYQLGVGATVLGGGLDILTTSVRSAQGTTTETFWAWGIAWDDRPWLRQVRLGDVNAGGPRGVPIQGGAVTNAPFMRPADFSREPLLGRLPPGWEVEVYRGEQLIGYQPVDPDGRYDVGVPVIYGQNPVDLVAYGPHGEVRQSSRTFVIPFERLPARRFEYNLGAGACRALSCEAAGNLDMRYGVVDRLTVQAGADLYTRDTLADLAHPYALASLAITRPLSLTGEFVANGLVRGRVDLDPSADLHLGAGYTRYDTTVVEPLIGSRLVAHQVDGSAFWRPGALGGELFFQGGFSLREGASRTNQSAFASATTRFIGARWFLQGRYLRDVSSGSSLVVGAMDFGGDGVVSRGPLRNTFLRASAGMECSGNTLDGCSNKLARWSLGLGRQMVRVLRLDAGVRKDRGSGGVTVELTLTAALAWMRATSRNSMTGVGATDSTASEFGGSQLLEGTVLWNRRQGRVDFSSGRNLGRAGVVGVVFLDSNNDGIQQSGEPGLEDVAVRIGTNATVTDSLGRFRSWDLVPFVPTLVELDTLTLANPLWYPAAVAQRLPPSPNAFRFVPVPVREGGEVNGRVEFDGRPLAGARVTLKDLRGRTFVATTFTDGAFYVMRLPPSTYEVSVEPGLTQQLGAQVEPVYVRVNDSSMRVDDVVVRVRTGCNSPTPCRSADSTLSAVRPVGGPHWQATRFQVNDRARLEHRRDLHRAAHYQYHPHPVHGCGGKGQQRPPRHADGAGAHRVPALHEADEAQPQGPALARPRPLRAVGRPRVHAAVQLAVPVRLRLVAR